MKYKQKTEKLKGELMVIKGIKIKPNFAALGREYQMDWRTVKKYYDGYEGKSGKRNKKSKLDKYRNEIIDKLAIKRITVKGVYEFMINKYGKERIGTYTNFNRYVKVKKLKPKAKTEGHPRFEREPGEQAQIDWKEDITLTNKNGEVFTVNVLHVTLKFSRYSHLELTTQKRFDDVARGLINSFRRFGGVPKECLFDNMSTVANVNAKPKKPTDAIAKMAKDFGFEVRLCGTRKPETKGTVEAKNKVIDWIRAYNGEFETLEDLVAIVEDINNKMNITLNQETDMSPSALFYKEREYLSPLPNNNIIDTYLTPNKYKVSSEGLIRYGNSRYSVDKKLINEEVTVDVFDNKLHIYYTGKLVACHYISENPINYKKDHYESLLSGKVKDDNIGSIAADNLEMMDKLLTIRKFSVSEEEATRSREALIAYINQSEYGKWVVNNFADLSSTNKLTFIKGMNEVLPYVSNRENFISNIKSSMKEHHCRHLALDCWVNDLMAADDEDRILSDEGFEALKQKYEKEIDAILEDISCQYSTGENTNISDDLNLDSAEVTNLSFN